MKTFNLKMMLAAFSIGMLASCTQDDDYETAEFTPVLLAEDFFHSNDGDLLDISNWTNVATSGGVLWKQQVYGGNGYAEFNPYLSGEASNVGWLISPAINMDTQEGEKLVFLSSQSYVSSASNKLEVFVSTDYDGTNVATATWIPVNASLPTTDATYFEFQKSGVIDLSAYTGSLHVAFKVTGGTSNALDGAYQIDSVRLYY